MSAQTTLISAEEFWKLIGEGKRCELVKGEAVEMAPAGGLHGDTANTIAFLLTSHVRQNDLGKIFAAETGFIISRNPDTVRAPDVSFVPKDRLPLGGVPSGFLAMTPDLVVEVVSPSDYATAIQEKAEMWLTAGVRLVWVVYPESQSVVVYDSLDEAKVLHVGNDLKGVPALEDFQVGVEDFFK